MQNENIPQNTNNNRNAVNVENKKASGSEAGQVASDRQNQIVIPPSVGQRNIVVRSKTMVLATPEGGKVPMWADADTLTPTEWKLFFSEGQSTRGNTRVRVIRQAVNPLSLRERQLAHAKRHPKDTTAKHTDPLGSESPEGAVEA
jgi:hypothetical protein